MEDPKTNIWFGGGGGLLSDKFWSIKENVSTLCMFVKF